MPPHTTIPARAAAGTGAALHRGRSALARAALAVGVLAAAATGTVTAGISPAAAAPAVLYAAATAAGTGDCSTTANACTLTTGLADVGPGGTIELVTPGSTAHYLGNWTVGTTGTSAAAPVTIQPAPGLASQPMLDGNRGNSGGCTTASCAGPVLAVGQNEYVALSGITIANGYNHTVPINQDGNGGGLYNSGTVTITGSTFSGNTALFGGAISNGLGTPDGGTGTGSVMATDTTFTGNTGIDGGGAIDSGAGALGTTGGTVTVTASTFSGNNGGSTGGAINSGYAEGAGTVTVTGSTFTKNTAGGGGAIDSGDNGLGTVTVADSTFSGNTATTGGAINSGEGGFYGGGGTVQVTASTFSGNTATTAGSTIESGYGNGNGAGTVRLAADLFDGSCARQAGTWTDAGYNAGSDASCFNGGTGDVNAGSSSALNLSALGHWDYGGPTQTIFPEPGSKARGIITDPTSITLGGGSVALCPATDQRVYTTPGGTSCDAGAVQTAGSAPLTLNGTASPDSYSAAGQVITDTYTVTNDSPGTLTGISITDPGGPVISCQAASLPPNSYETCTGTHKTTAKDMTAGQIVDTATATGTTTAGVPVTSNPWQVGPLRSSWGGQMDGLNRPVAGFPEGYYLGMPQDPAGPHGNRWELYVTHPVPPPGNVTFTGTITINAGTFSNLARKNLGTGDSAQMSGKTLTFQITDNGAVKGIWFNTGISTYKITFTLSIDGQPATNGQFYLGANYQPPSQASSPFTFTR